MNKDNMHSLSVHAMALNFLAVLHALNCLVGKEIAEVSKLPNSGATNFFGISAFFCKKSCNFARILRKEHIIFFTTERENGRRESEYRGAAIAQI
ncbi:MAG: hypothetical protein J6M25_01800 [Prevotella sp.]|nr:hypothetical protein [Prevotella sp.]